MGTAYNMLGGGGAGGIKLESIAITAPPLKTAYRAGESFDPAGMVVTAAYSNGATLVATGCAAEPSGPLADGTTQVTVRYTEGGRSATASVAITVSPRLASLRIAAPPAKTAYRWGESFDPAGMAVEAVYTDGSAKPVSGFTTAPGQFAALGAQEVTVSYAEDGDAVTAAVSVTVGRAVIAAVPQQSGTPVYTGGVLSPEWSGFDPDKLTLGGTASAIDVGTYEAAFTPTPFYEWGDGSTAAKLVPWTIGRAAGILSLDKQAVTLNAAAPTAVLQAVRAGDGAVHAESSDTSVAAVSVSGTQITVSSVGQTTGSAVITVTVGEGTNHTAPASVMCQVTASFAMIYGAEWDGTSTTKLSRTDMAALFADPVPAVGNGAGSSPFDNIAPWNGMVRKTEDGNELVAIPKYWVKVSHIPFKVQISDVPVEGFQVSPAHRDRADGNGERDVVYIGRYECNNTYKSMSNQAVRCGINLGAFRTGIHNLGAKYWQADFALQLTWWFLYIVEYADWDSPATIGQGNVSSSAAIKTGATDAMVYHTGRAAGTDGKTAVQYRNIENPWGNIFEWRDGIIFSGTNICTYNNPSDFKDTYNGAGSVVRTNKTADKYGTITAWGHDANDSSFIFPSDVDSNVKNHTYSADTYQPGNGIAALVVSSSYYNGSRGAFYLGSFNAPSSTDSRMGSRLMKLP